MEGKGGNFTYLGLPLKEGSVVKQEMIPLCDEDSYSDLEQEERGSDDSGAEEESVSENNGKVEKEEVVEEDYDNSDDEVRKKNLPDLPYLMRNEQEAAMPQEGEEKSTGETLTEEGELVTSTTDTEADINPAVTSESVIDGDVQGEVVAAVEEEEVPAPSADAHESLPRKNIIIFRPHVIRTNRVASEFLRSLVSDPTNRMMKIKIGTLVHKHHTISFKHCMGDVIDATITRVHTMEAALGVLANDPELVTEFKGTAGGMGSVEAIKMTNARMCKRNVSNKELAAELAHMKVCMKVNPTLAGDASKITVCITDVLPKDTAENISKRKLYVGTFYTKETVVGFCGVKLFATEKKGTGEKGVALTAICFLAEKSRNMTSLFTKKRTDKATVVTIFCAQMSTVQMPTPRAIERADLPNNERLYRLATNARLSRGE